MSLNLPVNTGYSAFWQTTGDKTQYQFQTAAGQQRAKGAWRVAKLFNKYGTRDVQVVIAHILGAAPTVLQNSGFTAVPNPSGPSATVPQVTGVGDMGGLRTAVSPSTSQVYNRIPTAADVTELKKWFSSALMEEGITYPTRLGPGGGSMIKGGMSAFV